jgi:mRNA interferase MazF
LFRPGEVVIADFPGATAMKRRPAVVLSSDLYHKTRPDVIIGLVTSQTAAAIERTDYVLQDWASIGLKRPSAFRSFVVTIPRSAVLGRIGRLSSNDWAAVRERVKLALDDLESRESSENA